jgi:hypothetical protein
LLVAIQNPAIQLPDKGFDLFYIMICHTQKVPNKPTKKNEQCKKN